MNGMPGKYLCEEVAFELTGTLPNIYQCHCSLCRNAPDLDSLLKRLQRKAGD